MNVTAEEVRGMDTKGEMYNGIIYSALDENGKRMGTPFKSSLFGKQTGYDALQNKYEKTANVVKEKKIREQLIPVVRNAMNASKTKEQLQSLLKKEKVHVIFRQNEQGRIYGVTFIDHNSKTVINGSRLGKEFSANQFQERFNNPENENQNNKPEQNKEMSSGDLVDKSIGSSIESAIGGLFGLLPMGTDIQEDYLQQHLKIPKKKKRKFGRQF
jgi:uncharacterized FlaG/YvyC family protein